MALESGCSKAEETMSCPELLSFLEANREAIKAEIVKILLQQMLLAAYRR